jgi:hypothetical protein
VPTRQIREFSAFSVSNALNIVLQSDASLLLMTVVDIYFL